MARSSSRSRGWTYASTASRSASRTRSARAASRSPSTRSRTSRSRPTRATFARRSSVSSMRRPAQIMLVAQQTLEGVLREVLSQLTPEEVNEDRLKFADSLVRNAKDDFDKLGLELDVLKVQHVSDEQKYLQNLGRAQIASMLRDAQNAENQAEQRVREEQAKARQRAESAQQQGESMVLQKRNGFRAEIAKLESEAQGDRERSPGRRRDRARHCGAGAAGSSRRAREARPSSGDGASRRGRGDRHKPRGRAAMRRPSSRTARRPLTRSACSSTSGARRAARLATSTCSSSSMSSSRRPCSARAGDVGRATRNRRRRRCRELDRGRVGILARAWRVCSRRLDARWASTSAASSRAR